MNERRPWAALWRASAGLGGALRWARASLCVALVCAGPVACAPGPVRPPRTIIRAGRLFDGTLAATREHVRVTIADGIIAAIEPDEDASLVTIADAAVIDARDATVLPGLIDVGASLAGEACRGGLFGVGRVAQALRSRLAAGVTSLVVYGASVTRELGLQSFIDTSRHRGPRIFVGARLLATVGAAAVEAARVEVQHVADQGAEWAVLHVLDRGATAAGVQSAAPLAAPADTWLCAAVREAHEQELRALVLAENDAATYEAARCRPDGVLLASTAWGEPGARQRLRDARVPMSLLPPATAVGALPSPTLLEPSLAPLMLASGPTACTVASFDEEPALAVLRTWVEAGVSPRTALLAATHGSAVALGLDEALGRLAVGFRADLIVVAGHPDEDLAALHRVRLVMVDGVAQRVAPAPWYSSALAALHVLWSWIKAFGA